MVRRRRFPRSHTTAELNNLIVLTPPNLQPPKSEGVRLGELLAALSLATDSAMAFPPETALRTNLLAVRVGRELGLSEQQLEEIFYVSLLRHLGCTAYSHEEGVVVGDDNQFRRDFTGVDSRSLTAVAGTALTRLGAGTGPAGRLKTMAAVARSANELVLPRIVAAHCDASRQLARSLGLSAVVIQALDDIFERWDGKGHPQGLKGESISPAARITHFAHTVVLENWRRGPGGARAMVRRRANHDFDPVAAQLFLTKSEELLELVSANSVWEAALDAEPTSGPWLPLSRLNDLALAFAYFSDLKSPYTLGHCQGVAALVEASAKALGLPSIDVLHLRRAALLHNLGRVAIPNGIWDKPARLSGGEWERLRLYPYHSERILTRISALQPEADLVGSVQERLDGGGYYRGLPAAVISVQMRVLAAADVYVAMTEVRPYRPALSANDAADQLADEVEAGRLDREAVAAVLESAGHHKPRVGGAWPGGLTDREVEVLRAVAQAKPNKLIAQELVISEETVRNHVRHVYEKIGVSSRAGAALFAMENDLIRK